MKTKLLIFWLVLSLSTALVGQITIDGDMLDWQGVSPADTGKTSEGLGDMATGPEFDWQDIYMTSDSANLYIRATIDPSATFTGGYDNYDNPPIYELHLDVDIADTAGLDWGWWNIKSDYLISLSPFTNPDEPANETTILHYIGNHSASVWPVDWDSVGVAYGAVNGDDNEIEVAVPWEFIDANADVRPMLYGVGNYVWGNEDLVPNDVTAGGAPSYLINYNPYAGATNVQVNGADTNTAITIDGDLLDWNDVDYVDVGEAAEETGDMATGPEFDVKNVKMTSDTNNVYIMVEIDGSGTFTGGFDNYSAAPVYELHFETNFAKSVGLSWDWWHFGTDYKISLSAATDPDIAASEVTILHQHGGTNSEEYDSVGVATAMVNSDDNAIEVAVPRVSLSAGSNIRPMLYFVGNEDWNNEEYFPNDIISESGKGYVVDWNFYTGASVVPISGIRGETYITDEGNSIVSDYKLKQNYPNPFNPTTKINYIVPKESHVTVEVYNILGQHVKTLINKLQQANRYTVIWNGMNDNGQQVSSGVYFYKLTASGNFVQTRKMVLIR